MIPMLRASLAVLLALSPLSASAANVRVPAFKAPAVRASASARPAARVAPLALSASRLSTLSLARPAALAVRSARSASAVSAALAAAPAAAQAAAVPAAAARPAEGAFRAEPALAGIEASAAAQAEQPVEAPAAKPAKGQAAASPRAVRGLGARLAAGQLESLFDGSQRRADARANILPRREEPLPNGQSADSEPSAPAPEQVPGIRFQTWGLEGGERADAAAEARRELDADPADVASVEAALRGMIDEEQARYRIPSSQLKTVHVKRFEGRAGQADAIFALFRQQRDGFEVHGTDLSLTIKVLDGKPVVVSQDATLFPDLDVNTEFVLTDDQIMQAIAERTGASPSELARLQWLENKIVFAQGRWHTVKLYVADDLPFMIAVNVTDGTVFAWDNRDFIARAAPAGTGAKISGRTVDKGPILKDSQITEVPIPYLTVKLPGGKEVVTDANGRFSAAELVGFGLLNTVELTAELAGPWARIEDQQGRAPVVNIKLIPGEEVTVVINPETPITDERVLADINAFHKVNMSLAFLRDRGLSSDFMNGYQIPVRTNINDECNAYYTPGRPTLNFFRSSANCVNSAYDTVAEHENGHYWDDKTGGIKNGGLSEGWGDILSMFRLNNPIIGEKFLKRSRGGVDYIRHGENTYQYRERDQVHAQGQAWGGFAWKLRKMLVERLGYENGTAIAEALILPTMFAKARSIPDAVAQVLINAMKSDGTMMHEDLIREAARIHAIPLPKSPGKVAETAAR